MIIPLWFLKLLVGGKKLTGWGKNGPAYFFPGEKTDWGEIPACYTGFSDLQLCTRESNIFPINYAQTSLYFILLPVIMYNRCRGSSNHRYLIWYHSKIIICRNFDVWNRNAEIGLEKQYDSTKIGMVGISAKCIKLFFFPENLKNPSFEAKSPIWPYGQIWETLTLEDGQQTIPLADLEHCSREANS